MIKEANRRPPHAINGSFPSRNRDTPKIYTTNYTEKSINLQRLMTKNGGKMYTYATKI